MTNKSLGSTLFAISSVPFAIVTCNLLLFPVFPMMKSLLHLSSMKISYLLTVFSFAEATVILFVGYLSDRFGRIFTIVPSLFLFGVGGFIGGISIFYLGDKSYPFLILCRILQGMAAAGTFPIVLAFIWDSYHDSEAGKAIGIMESSSGVAKVVAPIVGSLLTYFSWYAAFFVCPIICFSLAIFLWITIKEGKTHCSISVLTYLKSLKRTFKKESKSLLPAFFIGSYGLCVLYSITFYLTFALENQYKITGLEKGFLLAIPLLGMGASAVRSGFKIKKDASFVRKGLVSGLCLLFSCQFFLAVFEELYVSIILLTISSISIGTFIPCVSTYISKVSRHLSKGMVSSLYGCFRSLGIACGMPITGWLVKDSHTALFLCNAGFGLIMIVLAVISHARIEEESLLNQEILD